MEMPVPASGCRTHAGWGRTRLYEGPASRAGIVPAVRLSAAIALAVVFALGSLPVVAQEAPDSPAAPALPVQPAAAAPAPTVLPGSQPVTPDAAAPEAVTPAPNAGASVPAARFVIEKIVVEGVRHGSQKIVAAETLLTLGSSYSEPQLQEALHRVERLPFVVQADFSLRRGGERGRFELVIAVTEAMPIVFGGTFELRRVDSSYDSGFAGSDYSDSLWRGTGRPEIGGRVFFGDHSEVSAALAGPFVTPDAPSLGSVLAYTHHNLFGRHIVGSASLSAPSGSPLTTFVAVAQLAFPLSRADALLLRGDMRVNDAFRDYRSQAASMNVSWQHDTTDDPFIPRRGSRSEALDRILGERLPRRPTGCVVGLVHGGHYWSLIRSLSLGLTGSFQGFDVVRAEGTDFWFASAMGGARLIGMIPWGRAAATHYWWEFDISSTYAGNHSGVEQLPAYSFTLRSTATTLTASISGRGRWGTVTLALKYEHSGTRVSN